MARKEDVCWALGGWLRVVTGVRTAHLLVWSPRIDEPLENNLRAQHLPHLPLG